MGLDRYKVNGTWKQNGVTEIYTDKRYGCWSFKPRCLQFLNSIRWHMFLQCFFYFFEGFMVNGVINVVIPALEKRYNLSSSKSGLIASANDIGALSVLLFVGYFGEQRHKPRLMTCGILVMCLGCLIFGLPQFLGSTHSYTISGQTQNGSDNICFMKNQSEVTTCQANGGADDTSAYNGYYAMFLIGQLLLGIGAVPMFTIGLSYVDENCKAKMTSLYFGLDFCFAAIGVAVGYIVGGQTLGIYVDVDKLDTKTVPLTPMDPQWVGAWWIGVFISLVGFLISAIPILGYPKHLPGYEELQLGRKSEAHDSGTEEILAQTSFGKGWKDMPKSFLFLIKNPTFIFLCLGGTMEALIIGGLATFGAKLIQQFHDVDLITAGAIMGFITIPGSGGGMLLGGYLVKRFKLKCRGILRLCGGCALICMLLGPSFLAFCLDAPIAGITTNYLSEKSNGLISLCNTDCGCNTQGHEPVCDRDGRSYFSPCHAGCKNIYTQNDTKVYYECSCVNTTLPPTDEWTVAAQVKPGNCTDQCHLLYLFCVLLFLMMLFTFNNMPPTTTACFRCVPYKQRSFAMSLQLIVTRLLGTFPGPILLGSIIDNACDVWQVSECGVTGSCWIYKKYDLGLYLLGWWMSCKFVGAMFYLIASKVYKPPPEGEGDGENKEYNIDNKPPIPSVDLSLNMTDIQKNTNYVTKM